MSVKHNLIFPIEDIDTNTFHIRDQILISGRIYCGRDAVLPRLVGMMGDGTINDSDIHLFGSLIFHTAVSYAGVGPTSSNKYEIESSMEALSRAGVRMHLGKGALKPETVQILKKYRSVYAVIPPVTALLESRTKSRRIVAFPELGMEALYELEVEEYPAVIAAVNGKSLYDREYEY